MSEGKYEVMKISDLKIEDGARELGSSPEMQPYLDFALAVIRHADPTPVLEAIRQLPLEERYVWRIASALRLGFADFDSMNLEADKRTLTPGDLAKVMDLLKLRPMQFCLFLKALVGAEEMQKLMVQAVGMAK